MIKESCNVIGREIVLVYYLFDVEALFCKNWFFIMNYFKLAIPLIPIKDTLPSLGMFGRG